MKNSPRFLDAVKAELIAGGIDRQLFDYFEDRIAEIVADKLSQQLGDIEERLSEEFEALIRKRT